MRHYCYRWEIVYRHNSPNTAIRILRCASHLAHIRALFLITAHLIRPWRVILLWFPPINRIILWQVTSTNLLWNYSHRDPLWLHQSPQWCQIAVRTSSKAFKRLIYLLITGKCIHILCPLFSLTHTRTLMEAVGGESNFGHIFTTFLLLSEMVVLPVEVLPFLLCMCALAWPV